MKGYDGILQGDDACLDWGRSFVTLAAPTPRNEKEGAGMKFRRS